VRRRAADRVARGGTDELVRISVVRIVAETRATIPIVVGVTGEFVAAALAKSLARLVAM